MLGRNARTKRHNEAPSRDARRRSSSSSRSATRASAAASLRAGRRAAFARSPVAPRGAAVAAAAPPPKHCSHALVLGAAVRARALQLTAAAASWLDDGGAPAHSPSRTRVHSLLPPAHRLIPPASPPPHSSPHCPSRAARRPRTPRRAARVSEDFCTPPARASRPCLSLASSAAPSLARRAPTGTRSTLLPDTRLTPPARARFRARAIPSLPRVGGKSGIDAGDAVVAG